MISKSIIDIIAFKIIINDKHKKELKLLIIRATNFINFSATIISYWTFIITVRASHSISTVFYTWRNQFSGVLQNAMHYVTID